MNTRWENWEATFGQITAEYEVVNVQETDYVDLIR